MELVVSAIIALIVVGFIGYPLLKEQTGADDPEPALSEEAEELYRRKEGTYSALKELEFDYKTGKLSEVDYQELEGRYRAEAIEVLEAIDALETQGSTRGGRAAERAGTASAEVALPADGDETPVETAPRRGRKAAGKAKAPRVVCGECGATHNPPGARFCGACGSALPAAAEGGSSNGGGADGPSEPSACDECGAAVEPDHRFCGSCGAEVRS